MAGMSMRPRTKIVCTLGPSSRFEEMLEKLLKAGMNVARFNFSHGSSVLCADGTISLTVLECDRENGKIRFRCETSTTLGERKNVNLPGVVVDLPTLTEKDKEDILQWGIPNNIDIITLFCSQRF
ncbi:hypothetical protein K1719_007882 [Acacia pycnantha]|nr:hypothetical protein K1719_007882 [Acacia pycnantha]